MTKTRVAGGALFFSDRQIGADLGQEHTIIWRERRRNSTKTRGYRPVSADCSAERRRGRPQVLNLDTDVVLTALAKEDLAIFRTKQQIAGYLRLEANGAASVEIMTESSGAEGRTISHETIYRWICGLRKIGTEIHAKELCGVTGAFDGTVDGGTDYAEKFGNLGSEY